MILTFNGFALGAQLRLKQLDQLDDPIGCHSYPNERLNREFEGLHLVRAYPRRDYWRNSAGKGEEKFVVHRRNHERVREMNGHVEILNPRAVNLNTLRLNWTPAIFSSFHLLG